MNNISSQTSKECVSCGICSVVCPKNAITMQDTDGFYKPCISDACVNCGLCQKVCIKYNQVSCNKKENKIYAVYNKDTIILSKSSSGGISYELMKYAVSHGYKVLGCAYDYENRLALHKIARNIDDLNSFFGSKYMQSKFWVELQDVLASTDKYFVFGTPCQIYAMKQLIDYRQIGDRFVLIDFFCHGTPTRLIWENERQDVEKNYGAIKNIVFRTKAKGWHNFANEYEMAEKKIVPKFNTAFELFFSDKLLNKACYTCDIRTSFDYADIRIGDFWGDKYIDNSQGVSVLLLNNKAAEEIFENIKDKFVCNVEDDGYRKYQALSNDNLFNYDKSLYNKMMLSIKQGDNRQAYQTFYNSLTIKQKIKLKLKKIINLLPAKIKNQVKKLYYHTS